MDTTEIATLAAVEERHWWYSERRTLLRRQLRDLPVDGLAVDIGAAGGGNTRVLRSLGWTALALEYDAHGARVACDRGLLSARADARALPVADGAAGLVVAFDLLEHIVEDNVVAAEIHRVLRPGGLALIAVPADPKLWSAHDEAVSHVRRYTRETLVTCLEGAGLQIESVASWNVLLRPAVALRRRRSTGSDLDDPPALLNRSLHAVVALERWLPVGRLPGVSLVVRARRSR